jgi:hypothetical protein
LLHTKGYVYPYASTGSNHSHRPEVAREIVQKLIKQEKFRGKKEEQRFIDDVRSFVRSFVRSVVIGIKLRVKGPESQLDDIVNYVAAARDEAGPGQQMAQMVLILLTILHK